MRIIQGIARGGAYGGAASYVAEHAPDARRGRWTRYIEAMASTGLLMPLPVVIACRLGLGASRFEVWGWRLPFLLVARTGNIYAGLAYPLAFCAIGVVVTLLALPETAGRPLSACGAINETRSRTTTKGSFAR